MNTPDEPASDPRIAAAVAELQGLIQTRYPAATFAVARGDDPQGTYVVATVDVADADEVFDVVVGRLLEMQVEEGLPVHVLPVRPVERVAAELRAGRTPTCAKPAKPPLNGAVPPEPGVPRLLDPSTLDS